VQDVDEIMELIQRKSQLMYDINCVRGYMETWEFNSYLKDAWDQMNKELLELSSRIEELSNPQYKEILQQRMEIINKIQDCDRELEKYKNQLKELDENINKVRKISMTQ
jgi:chromosome segregation ATPase